MHNVYWLDKEKQSDGYHKVHTAQCMHGPQDRRRQTYLGGYANCLYAIREARMIYPQSKGCLFCCRL